MQRTVVTSAVIGAVGVGLYAWGTGSHWLVGLLVGALVGAVGGVLYQRWRGPVL